MYDIRLLQRTIEDCFRLGRKGAGPGKQLGLDQADDAQEVRYLLEVVSGYLAHIRSRGKETQRLQGCKPCGWPVERTHSWRNPLRSKPLGEEGGEL